MPVTKNVHGMSLLQWVWKYFFKASLLPLLLLEFVLIGVYFFSIHFSNQANIETFHNTAEHELAHLAKREANGIDQQLKAITYATSYLQAYSATVTSGKASVLKDDPARFAYSANGAYYTTKDTGGSAVFYSGYVPVGKAEREKAWRSVALDPALIGIKQTFPLVAQVYLNTHDSLNRIYPYFDVIKQYAEKMDIPSFNFYYEADARHNPSRSTVWTDVYIDPAGKGWMTSCIAPVYNRGRPDFLEGVVGVDVTLKNILDAVREIEIPWQGYAMLISRNGTILALPQHAEADWGIKNLTKSNYPEAIKQDTFRSDEFNVYLKPVVAQFLKNNSEGFQHVKLTSDSFMGWASIPATGWKIIIVATDAQIFRPVNLLANRLNDIASLMVVGMMVFYAVFFYVTYRRTVKMSLAITKPLKSIDAMVANIASGKTVAGRFDFVVDELNSTAAGILDMGIQLETAKQDRADAAEELREKSEQLQVIFDISPSGYLLVNEENEIVLSNNAFSHLLGISPQDVREMPEIDFWRRLGAKSITPLDRSAMKKIGQRIDIQMPRPSTLFCGIREIVLPDNSVLGKVYYFHDITKDEEVDRIKDDFMAHANHELRTPLTTILGYSELLVTGRVSADKQMDMVTQIYHESAHLVKMINELLDLTKIAERAGMDFTILPCSLTTVITEFIAAFPIPESRKAIVFDNSGIDVIINADKIKFKQALHNIVENAYKFSPPDSEVLLKVIKDPDSHLVSIEVADHGIGMAENEIAQAFDRFYRADKTGNVPGTGLGLSLAKEIMAIMNGTITINSSPDAGTQVMVIMPATDW